MTVVWRRLRTYTNRTCRLQTTRSVTLATPDDRVLFHCIINYLMNPRSNIQAIQSGIISRWVHSIRKKDVHQFMLRICPGKGACITRVSEAGRAGVFCYRTCFFIVFNQGFIKTEATTISFFTILTAGKLLYRFASGFVRGSES